MRNTIVLNRAWILAAIVCMITAAAWAADGPYRSPYDLALSPDGKTLAVSDHTAKALVLLDPASGQVLRQAALDGQATAAAWAADSSKIYVTQRDKAAVAEVNAADAKVLRQIKVGPYPVGLAIAAKRGLLLVANTGLSDISVIDLATGNEKSKIKALREPFWISISPDESTAVVSNLLPSGSAWDPLLTGAVSIIDLDKLQRTQDIKLPPNTTAIRQTAISPDGRWAYAVHTVGRTTLPATQLERGWVNTNALSIIDLKARKLYASVLLDNLSEGGADPWGVALSKDGNTMWITLAGVHQVARVELAALHEGLDGKLPPALRPGATSNPPPPGVWAEIKSDPAKRADLVNDLTALYIGSLVTRVNLPGKAPRGIALLDGGRQLAVGMYYSGQVLKLDSETCKVLSTIALGPSTAPDEVRHGEMVFHDATYSFQHWLSCASCHPNQARADGLNWDLPNDGIGNPKSAKSLLYAYKTPPAMWTGIRDNMETAAMAGFRFAAYQPESQDLKAVQAYLRSLKAEVSPYRLPNGDLSEKAKRGKILFESKEVHCAACHTGEFHTDRHAYNVGTQGELDHKDQDTFDTPTLIELWRTAPYMHDGRAATLQEVFTKFNPEDRHGKTAHLTKDQIDDLVEYLLSL